LVDGRSELMSPPADIYQGVVVVADTFKDKVSTACLRCLAWRRKRSLFLRKSKRW
jgi:hypothetical protein